MNRTTKRVLCGVLAVSVFLSLVWEFYPLPDASRRLELLTGSTMGFTGLDVPLTATEEKVFAGVHLVKRVYHRGDVCFMVMVIDGTKDRHSVHDPMYCFRGAGWKEVGEADIPMAGGKGRWLRLQKQDRESEVVYWFSDGTSRYISPVRYWCQTALRRLTLGSLGEEPVLVVVQPWRDRVVDWRRVLKTFVPLQQI